MQTKETEVLQWFTQEGQQRQQTLKPHLLTAVRKKNFPFWPKVTPKSLKQEHSPAQLQKHWERAMGQRKQTASSEHSDKQERQQKVKRQLEGTLIDWLSQIDANKKIQHLHEEKEELKAVIREVLKEVEEAGAKEMIIRQMMS